MSSQDFVEFYCYNGSQPSRTKFLIGGSGKIVNPDGSKKMDVGFREYRANASGICRVPVSDAEAVERIRAQTKFSMSGVTEDREVFLSITLPPERKALRDANREKARAEAALAEVESLKAQLKAQDEGRKGK